MQAKEMTMFSMDFVGVDNPHLNYWQSEYCKRGLFFLHWEGGVGRLMVPDDKVGSMAEMATGRHVRLEIALLHDGIVFTLWFDDGTDAPFCLYIDQNCMGGSFSKQNKMKLHVYSRRGRKQCYKIKSAKLTRRIPVLDGIW